MDGGGSRSPGAEHLCQGAGPVAAGAGPVPGVGAGCELPMSAVPEPQPVHEGEEVGSRREPTRDGWDAVQGAVARVRVLTGSAYPIEKRLPGPASCVHLSGSFMLRPPRGQEHFTVWSWGDSCHLFIDITLYSSFPLVL